MGFFDKIKQGFSRFMQGRNGTDQLSLLLLWVGLIFYIIAPIFGGIKTSVVFTIISSLFSFLGAICYVLSIWRIFSKQVEKRQAENRRYVSWMNNKKLKLKQAKVRRANKDKYTYFKCPGCKAWMKLPKNSGTVTITCSRCHTSFTQKS